LGRIRITAQSATLRREIILNPTTGIILRDLWWPIGDADPDGQIFDPSEGEGNLPGHDDDDDDDDEDDDDDDDDGADDD